MATRGWKTDATYSRYNIVDVVGLRQGARAMQLVDTLSDGAEGRNLAH
jgi:hypothetical protein